MNWQDSGLTTPLYLACQNGHIEVVKILLNDQRIVVNKATNDSSTPFYVACEKDILILWSYY